MKNDKTEIFMVKDSPELLAKKLNLPEIWKKDHKDVIVDKEKMLKLLKKVKKIQNQKYVIKNDEFQEAKKGRYRNEKCPFCSQKAKNCICLTV